MNKDDINKLLFELQFLTRKSMDNINQEKKEEIEKRINKIYEIITNELNDNNPFSFLE